MAKYKASIITSKGQELMTKATSGEAKIEFTKAVFGSGEWSDEDISPDISELKEQKQSVSISSMKVSSEQKNVVNLSAVLSNDNLGEGYFINEIGLYARDKNAENSEEILYFIIVAEKGYSDYFPASSYSPVKILQDFYIEVADSSDTAIAIDNKVAVTLPYLKENYYDKTDIDNKFEESEIATVEKVNNLNTKIKELTIVSSLTDFSENTFDEFKSSSGLEDIKSGNVFYIVFLKNDFACLKVTETSHGTMQSYEVTQELSHGANTYTRIGAMGPGVMRPEWEEWK